MSMIDVTCNRFTYEEPRDCDLCGVNCIRD